MRINFFINSLPMNNLSTLKIFVFSISLFFGQLIAQNTMSPANWNNDIKKRIERGDDINFKDSTGKTFLIKAIEYKDPKTAEYLIKKGADVNITDNNGVSALMYAVSIGDLETSELLFKSNAEYLKTDAQGLSLLSYTEKSNNKKIENLVHNYIVPIKWLTITEAEKLCKKEPRIIIVDVFTDWCGWCKVMDQKTFSHPYISNYISKNFYAVKYNAESKDSLTFNGKKYINPSPELKKSTNQFAAYLLKGKLAYPSLVFIDGNLNTIQYAQGYKKVKEMEALLNYFQTGAYKNVDFQVFQKGFVSEIKEDINN